MPTQDELIQMLISGQLGPWAGQGFVPGGITILRPDTGQWETILGVPGDADLMTSTLGDPVDISGLLDPTDAEQEMVNGFLDAGGGLGGTIAGSGGGGGAGHPVASVVTAQNYTIQDFTRTELGEIRLTEGQSNGANGPLSPIRAGTNATEVDKDGNLWLPRVRFGGVDAERRGPSGPGGMW